MSMSIFLKYDVFEISNMNYRKYRLLAYYFFTSGNFVYAHNSRGQKYYFFYMPYLVVLPWYKIPLTKKKNCSKAVGLFMLDINIPFSAKLYKVKQTSYKHVN